jgi:cytolysin (calcineurin-like family phosphatase)
MILNTYKTLSERANTKPVRSAMNSCIFRGEYERRIGIQSTFQNSSTIYGYGKIYSIGQSKKGAILAKRGRVISG